MDNTIYFTNYLIQIKMTNFENIKNVKQLLNSEAKYNSVTILAKDSGASYYYIKALIETNIIGKLNSRYVWLKEEEPNIRTFKKLRDIASRIKREINNKQKRVVSHQVNRSVVDHSVTAGNGITINFSNGKAVVRRNGRSIECDDLQSVESLIKFIS